MLHIFASGLRSHEAHAMRGVLEDYGVRSYVWHELGAMMDGELTWGGASLAVHEDDWEIAEEIALAPVDEESRRELEEQPEAAQFYGRPYPRFIDFLVMNLWIWGAVWLLVRLVIPICPLLDEIGQGTADYRAIRLVILGFLTSSVVYLAAAMVCATVMTGMLAVLGWMRRSERARCYFGLVLVIFYSPLSLLVAFVLNWNARINQSKR